MSRRFTTVLLIILSALLVMPTKPAQAQSGPEVLKVGIYLIRAGSLDITTGAIDVDFYIEFTCPGVCKEKTTDFEIINGTAKTKTLLDDEDKETKPTYRVSATVYQEVNLRKYPFDSHDVEIIIESSNFADTGVKYEVNEETTAIDPDVFIIGWNKPQEGVGRIEPHEYAPWESNYTRYIFTVHLSKPPLSGWLKGLLPGIIIVLGSLFALFITSKNVGNRVAIITSALVSSVLYHINFTSRVPSIGYLTFGDFFMIINYLVLLISLSLTIWIIRSDAPDKQPLIIRANKLELSIVPLLWLVLQILNYQLIIARG